MLFVRPQHVPHAPWHVVKDRAVLTACGQDFKTKTPWTKPDALTIVEEHHICVSCRVRSGSYRNKHSHRSTNQNMRRPT